MNLEVTVDGSSSPWRRGAVGIVIRDADTRNILLMEHVSLQGHVTNNAAEYGALEIGAVFAKKFLPGKVVFFTDSQLVLRQLKGEYAVRDSRLRELHRKVTWAMKELKATVKWHNRETGDHPLADRLASYKYKEVFNEANHRDQPGGVGRVREGEAEQVRSADSHGGGMACLENERGSPRQPDCDGGGRDVTCCAGA